MNQILIEHLDPAAWRAKPPGKSRTIAAIFTHMHNVRSKWVRLTAPHLKVPRQLNRAHCTPRQARAGLAESAARCAEMLAEALGGCGGRVEKFRRDGWAPPWPVGLEMLCYMLSHEAHHRGQVCMLAHQLGFPVATNHLNPNFFRRLRLVASIAPTDRCPCFHPRWMTRQSWFHPSRRGKALPVLRRAHAIRASRPRCLRFSPASAGSCARLYRVVSAGALVLSAAW